MSKKRKNIPPAAVAPTQTNKQKPSGTKPPFYLILGKSRWIYPLIFILLWIFCSGIYGDVFRRAAEANFITTDDTLMKNLTDQDWGGLYWWGRWILLAFKSTLLGGALLSLILTATIFFIDRLLNWRGGWRGLSIFVPGLTLGWMIWRGTNLYYKSEPSLIFIVPLAILLFFAAITSVKALLRRKRNTVPSETDKPFGLVAAALVIAALSFSALHFNDNEIRTARMQLSSMQGNWDSMVEDGLSATRATRAVSAYYAIGLLQKGELLHRLFEMPYDFPEARLEKHDGNEEYGMFVADANFYAGLINPAYRCAMDQIVMNGPNLFYLKRMAICAVLNGEKALANKYFDVIDKVPFEGNFVEKYRPMLEDSTLITADPELLRVKELHPMESRFEQSYRTPAFLGYNVGLLSGTDATLETAIAACLYSKDLQQAMNYISVYAKKKNGVLPIVVEQAIAILANKVPSVAQAFPQVVQKYASGLRAFLIDATPLINERKQLSAGKSKEEQERIKEEFNNKLRKAMKDNWLGTYYYYYYCENNDPKQVRKADNNAGVN